MAGLIGSKKHLVLLLLLFLTYCDAKAIDAFNDDPTTTPCPEELNEATTTVQASEGETERSVLGDVTTLCPEELGKRRQNEILSEKSPEASGNQDDSSKETAEDVTTECPEELEKRKSEAKLSNSKQDSSTTSEDSVQNDEEQRFEVDSSANESGSKVAETTICPEELAKEKQLAEFNTEVVEQEDATTTTECPEELAKNEIETTEEAENEKVNSSPWTPEVATTTECPEELAKRQQQNKMPGTFVDQLPQEQKLHHFSSANPADIESNKLSVKTLLAVQKNSALLKVVKDQMQHTEKNQAETIHRSKRQTAADYSQYYAKQPSYNSQGQATSLKKSTQNFHSPQSQAISNTRKASYNNVRTYQQIQRQYQNYVPKSYQNSVKPVTSYQNPSLYVRHPSNGNFKNYYKLKSGGNRRQFQANRRPSSTTFRSTTKRILKKKFRPSPVFA